uniref:Uncharacterized protein n=1 Tax=Lygus hesperus TaxID=30085 RepID=A0A0A9ZC81_LYGHE
MSLDRFFTPQGDKVKERKRKNSSPEANSVTPKRKGASVKMLSKEDMDELMRRFGILMDTKLDEKIDSLKSELATKAQIDSLELKVDCLQKENEALRTKMNSFRSELDKSNLKMEKLDSMARRKNLVFMGLKQTSTSGDLRSLVCTFITDVLHVSPVPAFEEIIPLGKGSNSPLLVKFERINEVFNILKHTSRLRGTSFGVNRDYTDGVRLSRRYLFQLRKEILRIRPDCNSFVRHDTLVINNSSFRWSHDTGVLYKNGNGVQQLNNIVGSDLGPFVNGLLTGGEIAITNAEGSQLT